MRRVVFLSRDKDQFIEIEQMLTRKELTIEWIGTGKDLLSLLSDTSRNQADMNQGDMIDLVILEEAVEDATARPLVESIITQSPMTNCVVAGSMDKKKFHDLYEGYGVLMQLPLCPAKEDAENLIAHLDKIMALGC